MKFVMYQDCVSPHQLPLAHELVKCLGAENFRYVYRDREQGDRVKLGWQMDGSESWFVHCGSRPDVAQKLIEDADNLLTMFRLPDLFARRAAKGLKTFYQSERWFKPIMIGGCARWSLPGWVKLLHPGYFKMAWQISRLLKTQPNFHYLPIGPHAARDMRLLCSLYQFFTFRFSLFTPEFIPWGYFVAPSDKKDCATPQLPTATQISASLRVLYVGRFLALKRIDTIIRAVAEVAKRGTPVTLTLVGSGPEESRLKKLASTVGHRLHPQPSPSPLITFLPPVPISEVRSIMRQHDVLVFASNAFDGWGAVINEALSEGVAAIGTYETGAAAALLPERQLFHCGNWRELADKLVTFPGQFATSTLQKNYTPSGACDMLLNHCNGGRLK